MNFNILFLTSISLLATGCVASSQIDDIDMRLTAVENQTADFDNRIEELEHVSQKLDLRSIGHGCRLSFQPPLNNDTELPYSYRCID